MYFMIYAYTVCMSIDAYVYYVCICILAMPLIFWACSAKCINGVCI